MKKQFTLKKTITFVAFLLLGILASINAQVSLYKDGVLQGTQGQYTDIKAALGSSNANVPFVAAGTRAYVIELESSYTGEASYPLTLTAVSNASATNTITIRPAVGAKVTIGPANQTVIATVTGSTFTSSTTSVDLTGLITKGDISYLSSPSTSINVTTTASSNAATITSGTLTNGIYIISGNANIAANTTFNYTGSSSITLSTNATTSGTAVASTVNNKFISGIGTYSTLAFKTISAISGNTITVPSGTFTANSANGNKLYFGSAQTRAIYFNGAKYITIDGVSRTGATGLTIQNPNCIYAQTILFGSSSQYNTVKNCIIRGANQSGAWNNGYNGTIYFAGATYTTITNNDVCDMGDTNIPYPICAFQMTAAGGTNTNQTITNNNIYNVSNLYSGNGNYAFMQFGSDANAVNNNISHNRFYWTAPTTFRTAGFTFFGYATIGLGNRFDGNILGYGASDGSGKSTLTMTGSGTSYAISGMKNSTCKNNIIGGIDITGTSFVGIGLAAHTSAIDADSICFGNQVKDITVNSVAGGTLYGLFFSAAPFSNVNVKNNTVKNLTISSGTATIVNTVLGLSANFAASGTVAINCIGNEFSNLTSGTASPTASSAANVATGIVSGGCNVLFEKNLIYNLNTISSGTGSIIKGIRISLSTADGKLVKNNIIRLGTDVTSDAEISAIYHEALSNGSHPFNIYHNSIYIGGTSQTKPSHCMSRAGAIAGVVTLKNNIFSNKRTGSAAVNQIYNLYAATDITASSNNLYEYGTKFGTVTTTSPTTYTLMSDWVTAKSPTVVEAGSINQTSPLFIDASNATTPNLRVQTYSSAVAEKGTTGTGVTDDYTGVGSRATIPALGAYEFTHTSQATDYFRSLATGNWGSGATWQSSLDNINWATASAGPTSSAASVTIQNAHEVMVAANATASALTVNGGGKLTLNDTYSLNATSLSLLSDGNGTATFVDENLDGNNGTIGTTTVNQNLSSPLRTWYMSSPVTGAQPTGMDRIKYYNEVDNSWSTLYNAGLNGQTAQVYSGSFEMGKGYLVVPVSDNNIAFTGAINTGEKPIILKKTITDPVPAKTGFNLIGNPYPSYLDWSLVYAANSSKLSDATMWYRTKVETSTPGAYEYKFWTVTGAGVGSPADATKDIPPMQAFWVRTNTNNSVLTLNNDMRAHAPATYKALKAPAAKNNEMPLVRLQVSNGANTDEAVIYFSTNASNDRDAYDAPKMSNDNAAIPEIYTTLGTEQMVINGMNSIPMDQEIGLGLVAGDAASFSLKANEVSNLPANVKLILKDNVTKVETDITDGVSTYDFSPLTTSGNRFSVIFHSAGAVTGVDKQATDNTLLAYSNQRNQITLVNSDLSKVGSLVSVYNAVGQKLLSKQLAGRNTQIVGNFDAGVYMLTVNNITKKVIIK